MDQWTPTLPVFSRVTHCSKAREVNLILKFKAKLREVNYTPLSFLPNKKKKSPEESTSLLLQNMSFTSCAKRNILRPENSCCCSSQKWLPSVVMHRCLISERTSRSHWGADAYLCTLTLESTATTAFLTCGLSSGNKPVMRESP